jgi:glycosyltransferase involved in cell wall biosynthesis
VEDGTTGLLFEVGHVQALTRSLQTLVGDPALRHQLGQAARERVLALFCSADITRSVLDVYARLTAQAPPRG